MDIITDSDEKRKVPPMLQKILRTDVQITKKFVDSALRTTALRSLRNHAKFLEISCHGIVWLASWMSFIWLFPNKDLYQLQVNMLIALILDIIVIAVTKAVVRRRRPVPMNKLLEVGPDKYSFPSGHASRAVLVAFILIFLSSVPIFVYPPLFAWVIAVSVSRVLLERHYIVDVLAGVGIGIVEGLFMSLIWFSQSTSSSILSSLSDEKRDGELAKPPASPIEATYRVKCSKQSVPFLGEVRVHAGGEAPAVKMRKLKGAVKETAKQKRERKQEFAKMRQQIHTIVIPTFALIFLLICVYVYFKTRQPI